MKKKLSLAIVLSFILLAFVPVEDPYFQITKNLDIFSSMFREVNAFYVDEVNPESLTISGIDGMLESLDPYTVYIPEEEKEAFTILTTGQYAGIGALISTINNKNVVTHPYKNFPAHKAGVKVGDEIIEVDGKNVRGKPTRETSTLLKGNPESQVSITVDRQGKEFTFKLTREQIKISNVTYRGILGSGIGYILIEEFTPGAGKEVEVAVMELKQQGATSLILDLRGNPGGQLHEAVNIVNLFVPKGKEVVAMKGKLPEWNKAYGTLNPPLDLEIPLVVLVDDGSASASEIVAGALQDYDRAVLIGHKTYGKGLVQTSKHLSYGAQVKVTTARYYIPSGRCIQSRDFSHREQDGSVNRIADSLKHPFKTTNGRTVYDVGGLDPDVPVKRRAFGPAVVQLAQSGLFFEYASKFCFEHPEPASFVNFALTDAQYKTFETWLKSKKFVYSTGLEKQIASMMETARESRNQNELQPPLLAMKNKVAENHAGYMGRFRDEIQPLLEEQIGFHYALHRGQVETSLDHDQTLSEARRILTDPVAYRKLLQPR